MPFLAAFAVAAPEIAAAGVTAAEIAAAEAAAAAAAEAAAVAAAEQAAAATAAEAAAAASAASASAPQAAGIMEIGGATSANAPLTAEAVQAAATGQPVMTPEQLNYLQSSTASNAPGAVQGQTMLPPQPLPSTSGFNLGSANAAQSTSPYSLTGQAPAQGLQTSPTSMSSMFPKAEPTGFDKFAAMADKHPFMTGAAMYMGANQLGLLDPSGETFGEEKYSGPLSKYRLSPDFQGRTATPNVYKPTYAAEGGIMNANPVQAMSDQNNMLGYQQAAQATGGEVAHFAKGGNLADSLDYYKQMMGDTQLKAPNEPGWSGSTGIARDDDPDTRSQNALTAAQIRNAKISKRANLSIPSMKRAVPMGQINMAPQGVKAVAQDDVQEAAGGGIMGASNLGSYAAGGSPRLLKGPGDGMSDNIPAVIGRKQPARLADGEFVIPADVVSHLGNGSTDAGAKRLHEMMNKVRKDRTGNSKQGKQINATKYMPK